MVVGMMNNRHGKLMESSRPEIKIEKCRINHQINHGSLSPKKRISITKKMEDFWKKK